MAFETNSGTSDDQGCKCWNVFAPMYYRFSDQLPPLANAQGRYLVKADFEQLAATCTSLKVSRTPRLTDPLALIRLMLAVCVAAIVLL